MWQAEIYQPDVVDPPIDPGRPTDAAIVAAVHRNTMAIARIVARLKQFDGTLKP